MAENMSLEAVRLAHIQIFPIKSLPAVTLEETAVCSNGTCRTTAAGHSSTAKANSSTPSGRPRFTCSEPSSRLIWPPSPFRPPARRPKHFRSAVIERAWSVTFRSSSGLPSASSSRPREVSRRYRGSRTDADQHGHARGGRRLVSHSFAEKRPAAICANLEFATAEPFWEDRLYGLAGSVVPFQIGTARLAGTNPCQRCVVPTRIR